MFIAFSGRELLANTCAVQIGRLARSLLESLDEQIPSTLATTRLNALLQESPEVIHPGRLIALAKAFRYFALFSDDFDSLSQIFERTLAEETKYLQAIRDETNMSEKASLVSHLNEFNRIFYQVLNDIDAEHLYSKVSLLKLRLSELRPQQLLASIGAPNSTSHSILQHLNQQYEKMFVRLFPITDQYEGISTADPKKEEIRPQLILDLESLDIYIAHRARLFLGLFLSFLHARGMDKKHPNAESAIQTVYEFESQRDFPISIEARLRNAEPIGKIKGKSADYKDLPAQERSEILMLVEAFHEYNTSFRNKRETEVVMNLLVDSFVLPQFFVPIQGGLSAEGLTLFQFGFLSNAKVTRQKILNACQQHPLFTR